MLRVFDEDKFSAALGLYVRPVLEHVYVAGALNQAALHDMVVSRGRRLTSGFGPPLQPAAPPPPLPAAQAQQLRELGLELPKGVSVELPPYLANRMRIAVDELLKEPYWDKLSETTRKEFESVLKDGLTKGQSIPQIRKKIEEVAPEYNLQRATNVARSETAWVQNKAALDLLKQANEELTGGMNEKSWLATHDDRVRQAHLEADGQVRQLDEMFVVGGEQCMAPGDPNLSPANRCQCRCALISAVTLDGLE